MNFLKFLNESKEQLDISILSAEKYLTNKTRIEEFLNIDTQIEHKTDGVKLTIVKQADNGELNDYIFAYKGNILYNKEYNYQPLTKIEKESIGSSQFKLVFDHFGKLSKNSIPIGTELFIEFLMKKPTLSSNYKVNHKMVLIGYSYSTWTEQFGILKTKPIGFYEEKRELYAKELKIDIPLFLFEGKMNSAQAFNSGIEHPLLLKEFNSRKQSMHWDNPEVLINDIKDLFLAIESKYGGREEGVIIKQNGRILKWQQDYQLDQKARTEIKNKYRDENPENETRYWNDVKRIAHSIASTIVVKSRKLDDVLGDLANSLKILKLDFLHSKKTEAIIKDDIQLNAKTLLIKSMRGNNNALIIGKFRVMTKDGHYKLIKRAQTLYDNAVVCIVSNTDTKKSVDLREKMIKLCFPKVHIIHANAGNLLSILRKSPININVVYTGTDRVRDYNEQLRNNVGIGVLELERTANDISASKVIANIEDKTFFMNNTPKEIHSTYEEIRKLYLNG